MKTVLIVFVLVLCKQTFAQHLNTNDEKLPSLILLKYPSIKHAFLNNLNNTVSFLEINEKLKINFNLDTGRRANRIFAFSQPQKINLNKELLKIMHRFPGDGSNLILCPRGLLVP